MGWLIALAIIILLAILPLGVSAKYDAAGLEAYLTVAFWKKALYPAPDKQEEKKEKKEDPAKQKKSGGASNQKKKEQGGKLTDFMPLVETGLALLNDLRKKIRVKNLQANIILAGDDPCDLATNYGRAWAALGNFWPRLERVFVIKKRDVQLQCDFTASQTLITAQIHVTLTFGRLLYLVVRYGTRALKQYLNIKKGGAVT